MNKKIIWLWLLLLQINFLVIWFRGENKDYFIYSVIIGGAASYGLACLLIFLLYREKKNILASTLHSILIFIAGTLLGGLVYFTLIVPLLQASLFIFLVTLLFTSIYIFKKKDLPELTEQV